MTLHPVPADVEPGTKFVEVGPEVGVGFAFPSEIEGLNYEVGIAVNSDFAVREFGCEFFVKIFKSLDDCHHFHPIVCAGLFVAFHPDFFIIVQNHRRPATRSWIADTTAVCVNFYFMHGPMITDSRVGFML